MFYMILVKESDPRGHVLTVMEALSPSEAGELLQAGIGKTSLLKS